MTTIAFALIALPLAFLLFLILYAANRSLMMGLDEAKKEVEQSDPNDPGSWTYVPRRLKRI